MEKRGGRPAKLRRLEEKKAVDKTVHKNICYFEIKSKCFICSILYFHKFFVDKSGLIWNEILTVVLQNNSSNRCKEESVRKAVFLIVI